MLAVSFALGAQAPGAQIKPLRLAVHGDGDRVDIGYPASVGVALGVADVVTELGDFAAYFAFHS